MCIAPVYLPDGLAVACRQCWQCRLNAVNDWVGRCIAESKTAKHSLAVTLTYGRDSMYHDVDHERAAILTYSDVQKYFKVLRRHGYSVRYFVAGEFGSKNGRAHWHGVLFFDGVMPEIELNKEKTVQGLWSHGFSHWSTMSEKSVRYACKYVLKDAADPWAQRKPVMSKKPPLGARYFEALAEKFVEQGLSPQNLEYMFPDVRRKDGPVRFRLGGRSAELFLIYYLAGWRTRHGSKPWPASELVDLFDEYGRVVTDESRVDLSTGWNFYRIEREKREAEARWRAKAEKSIGNSWNYERWPNVSSQ